MIETQLSIDVTKFPNRGFDTVPINHDIQVNNNITFIQNGTTPIVNWIYPEDTTCSGFYVTNRESMIGY